MGRETGDELIKADRGKSWLWMSWRGRRPIILPVVASSKEQHMHSISRIRELYDRTQRSPSLTPVCQKREIHSLPHKQLPSSCVFFFFAGASLLNKAMPRMLGFVIKKGVESHIFKFFHLLISVGAVMLGSFYGRTVFKTTDRSFVILTSFWRRTESQGGKSDLFGLQCPES